MKRTILFSLLLVVALTGAVAEVVRGRRPLLLGTPA